MFEVINKIWHSQICVSEKLPPEPSAVFDPPWVGAVWIIQGHGQHERQERTFRLLRSHV
jgi:hypothetical protein